MCVVIVPGEPIGAPATDAAVIEQSWAEPERFEEIFRRYFGQIHRYLAARVGGRTADDLAAEVFTIAFAQRQRYDLARECARPWLYRDRHQPGRHLPPPGAAPLPRASRTFLASSSFCAFLQLVGILDCMT
jgi:hypothetical protein